MQPERPSQQAEQPVQPLPQVSPSLLNGAAAATASVSGPQADLTQTAKVLWKRLLKDLSSLPRAIALMAATFGFSALGTFIPQNKVCYSLCHISDCMIIQHKQGTCAASSCGLDMPE